MRKKFEVEGELKLPDSISIKPVKVKGVLFMKEVDVADYKIYTKVELRKLEEVKELEYNTEDAVWLVDALDKDSEDNFGTVLVTKKGTRLKRQYKGAVQSDWFKGFKETIELFNYLFKEFDDVFINKGVYEVDIKPVEGRNFVLSGVNKNVKFHKEALIKVKPNNFGGKDTKTEVFTVGENGVDTENITLDGLTIQGEKHQHINDVDNEGGEWFVGLKIGNVVNSIIKNITITEMWGDGISFLFHRRAETGGKFDIKRAENITLENFIIDDCGRNGITVGSGYKLLIQNGKISRSDRTAPESGIDIELGEGTRLYGPWGDDTNDDITIRNVEVFENGDMGVVLFSHTGKVLIEDCNVHSNKGYGISSRHNNGEQKIRRTKTDGLLLHKLWRNNDFIVEDSEINGTTSIQYIESNVNIYFDKTKMIQTILKWWTSGKIEIKNCDIKYLRLSEIRNCIVNIKDSQFGGKDFTGFFGIKLEKDMGQVTIENNTISGVNRSRAIGLVVEKSVKIGRFLSFVKILNNHFYNNTKNTDIEVPITFEGNTDEQGEIIKL